MTKQESFASKISRGAKALACEKTVKAIAFFSEAQRIDPNNYLAYYYLGEGALLMMDYRQAETMFNHAADLFATYNPKGKELPGKKNKAVRFSQARLYRETDRWDEALSLLDDLAADEEKAAQTIIARENILRIRQGAAAELEHGRRAEAFRLLRNLIFQKALSGHPLAKVFNAKCDQ